MNFLQKLLGGVAAALLLSHSVTAAEVTLTVHHFLSPMAPAHTQFIEPWARQVQADSGGPIKVEIFPSMAMRSTGLSARMVRLPGGRSR